MLTDGSSSFDILPQSQPTSVSFPSSVTVMSIAPADEAYSSSTMKKILDIFESNGKVVKTDSHVDLESIAAFTRDVAKENYSSYNAVLKCGGIVSKIQLLPPPMVKDSFDLFAKTWRSCLTSLCNVTAVHIAGRFRPKNHAS